MKILKLIVVFFFVTVYAFANVSLTEKDALIAIYNATNGAEWNSTWDLSTSVDTWHGVKLEDNKIVEINLQFNNLQGKLPEQIGDLVHLRKINFGFNKLSGQLPASLKNLKELTSLELFMNRFEGHIPSELSELKKLESLKLYSNMFSGDIPESLMTLTNLEELLLSTNQFTGDLPMEFINLTKLNTIMVSDNNLNQEYISVSGKNPPTLMQLELQNSTATMDIEKD